MEYDYSKCINFFFVFFCWFKKTATIKVTAVFNRVA